MLFDLDHLTSTFFQCEQRGS